MSRTPRRDGQPLRLALGISVADDVSVELLNMDAHALWLAVRDSFYVAVGLRHTVSDLDGSALDLGVPLSGGDGDGQRHDLGLAFDVLGGHGDDEHHRLAVRVADALPLAFGVGLADSQCDAVTLAERLGEPQRRGLAFSAKNTSFDSMALLLITGGTQSVGEVVRGYCCNCFLIILIS